MTESTFLQVHGATVKSIAVFRALQLGDLLCAVPALRALRHAVPHARVTLIGLPWAQEMVRRYPAYVDDFIGFPGYPGMPEVAPDTRAFADFCDTARARQFDLAVQLHGDGRLSNGIVALLGARRTAGYTRPGAWCPDPDLYAHYPDSGSEIRRNLALIEHLGAATHGDELEFPLHAPDHASLDALPEAVALAGKPFVCIHPGARLNTRRWPAERFASVADALAERGLRVVLTGSSDEKALVGRVHSLMRQPAINLSGRTSLGALAALMQRAALLVSNDTGVSHIASALRVPSVIVCCGSDYLRWAPPDQRRHRVVYHDVACRPCAHRDCPFDHACASGVAAQRVIDEACALLDVKSLSRETS